GLDEFPELGSHFVQRAVAPPAATAPASEARSSTSRPRFGLTRLAVNVGVALALLTGYLMISDSPISDSVRTGFAAGNPHTDSKQDDKKRATPTPTRPPATATPTSKPSLTATPTPTKFGSGGDASKTTPTATPTATPDVNAQNHPSNNPATSSNPPCPPGKTVIVHQGH